MRVSRWKEDEAEEVDGDDEEEEEDDDQKGGDEGGGSDVALYDELIATRPEIEGKGDANPYTAVNGNMFTILLGSERLGIRLPEEERAKFLNKYGTTLLEAYGAVIKEYVAVPDGLLGKPKELARYLDLSYAYAGALKPKPSAKKK